MQTLILGGVRSGKSRLAENWATQWAQVHGGEVRYIATSCAHDSEMQQRIAHHQARRPAHWQTIEEPLALAQVLVAEARPQRVLLVDCLTLWLTNLLLCPEPDRWQQERAALFAVLPQLPGALLLVSNETGLGVVPLGALTRRYCDEAGWLHQDLAQQCQRVVWTIAGLPQILKGPPWTP